MTDMSGKRICITAQFETRRHATLHNYACTYVWHTVREGSSLSLAAAFLVLFALFPEELVRAFPRFPKMGPAPWDWQPQQLSTSKYLNNGGNLKRLD